MINEENLMTYRSNDDVNAEVIKLRLELRRQTEAAQELIYKLMVELNGHPEKSGIIGAISDYLIKIR